MVLFFADLLLLFLSYGNVGLRAPLLILFQVLHCPAVLTGALSAHQYVTHSISTTTASGPSPCLPGIMFKVGGVCDCLLGQR